MTWYPRVFVQEDQLGVSDKNTARTFYAAGNFYDILEQFPAKDPEAEVNKHRILVYHEHMS
jgi:hypothetical protein